MTCTWNPSDIGANITLSNGNLTWTSTSNAFTCGRSTQGWITGTGSGGGGVRSSNILYYEQNLTTVNFCGPGISNIGETVTLYCGQSSHGVAFYSNSHLTQSGAIQATWTTYTTPQRIGIVLRLFQAKIWWTLDGTTFNNDVIANQNPITNVGGYDLTAISTGGGVLGDPFNGFTTIYAAFGTLQSGNVGVANFGATPFTYAPLFASVVGIGGTAWDGSTGSTSQFMFAA